MKYTLGLEYIGEAQDAHVALYSGIIDQVSNGLGKQVIGKVRPRMPWVASLTGVDDKFGFKREFLNGNWQRKRSNSGGSRGTEIWFTLEHGKLYEVKSPVSWRSTHRYFCVVSDDGDMMRLSEAEAKEWLRNH